MFIKNSLSGIAGFIDLAVVPIKTALGKGGHSETQPQENGVRKVALWEETCDGVSVEKMLFNGQAQVAQVKAMEMIKAGRKLVLEGFPLEEVAAWCFTHNYRWRLHTGSVTQNSFILEPGKNFTSGAREVGVES